MQIRHIVIAIDGSPTSLAGMEAAAGLASLLHAAVTGLLIEDTNLLRMASLPFSRVIGSHSGAFRVVSTDDVERQFHSQADRARNTLWYAAERYRLTAAFSVARGISSLMNGPSTITSGVSPILPRGGGTARRCLAGRYATRSTSSPIRREISA